MEQQANYVPDKNKYNINNIKQVHPADATNDQEARAVARPMFSPSLKATHASSKIYVESNNSEMGPSGNFALRRAIEGMDITS